MKENGFKTKNIECDFCVVGGGMAGLCAAIAAARHGAKTVLVQDRPVLGGNASSEIRMWICGAHGVDNKETGLLEEIMLENLYRNPGLKYPVWDTVLYEKARYQENLTLLLNTTCTDLNRQRCQAKVSVLSFYHFSQVVQYPRFGFRDLPHIK